MCTPKEIKKIESKSRFYNLEDFLKLCSEKINFSNMEYNLKQYFNNVECKDKPGYISRESLHFILTKYNDKITDKDINEIIREVGADYNGCIKIETLVKEILNK